MTGVRIPVGAYFPVEFFGLWPLGEGFQINNAGQTDSEERGDVSLFAD